MGKLTNLNPPPAIADADVPENITRDQEAVALVAAHEQKSAPHVGHMPINPLHIELGQGLQNILDFHGGTSPVDFDVRIVSSGGIGQNGRGNLSLQAAEINLIGSIVLSLNGGAKLKRSLMGQFQINPPSVAAGGVIDIALSFPGVVAGDVAIFSPVSNPYNGLWTFNVSAYCVQNAVILFFHNAYTVAAVDLPEFTAKIVVFGFD